MLPLNLYVVYISLQFESAHGVWVYASRWREACALGANLLGVGLGDVIATQQDENSIIRAARQFNLFELVSLLEAKRDAKPLNIPRILEILNAIHLAEKSS